MRARRPSTSAMVACLSLLLALIAVPGWVRAQQPAAGGASYLPYGSMGGFVPYSPGPGQGLGVMPGGARAMIRTPQVGMRMLGEETALGQLGGSLKPPLPFGLQGMGTRPAGRMGSMGGLIRRPALGGGMGGMARPPVGNFPFRQPPSLIGPATTMPSMSM